jgi:hypothetical protein
MVHPALATTVFDFTEPSVFGSCDGFDMVATVAQIERHQRRHHPRPLLAR